MGGNENEKMEGGGRGRGPVPGRTPIYSPFRPLIPRVSPCTQRCAPELPSTVKHSRCMCDFFSSHNQKSAIQLTSEHLTHAGVPFHDHTAFHSKSHFDLVRRGHFPLCAGPLRLAFINKHVLSSCELPTTSTSICDVLRAPNGT